jgi:predicted site-specific integrase-resolvase
MGMAESYTPPEGFLTFAEAQAALGVSKATLQRRVRAGELDVYEDARDKRVRLVRREDIERLRQPVKSAA